MITIYIVVRDSVAHNAVENWCMSLMAKFDKVLLGT